MHTTTSQLESIENDLTRLREKAKFFEIKALRQERLALDARGKADRAQKEVNDRMSNLLELKARLRNSTTPIEEQA